MEWSFRKYAQLIRAYSASQRHSSAKYIGEIWDNWKGIQKNTPHGLALCYKVSKVNIVKVIYIRSVLKVFISNSFY